MYVENLSENLVQTTYLICLTMHMCYAKQTDSHSLLVIHQSIHYIEQ